MENIEYGGWKNCVRLSNASVELVITTDVGPRILGFQFKGRDNLFYEAADQLGKTEGEDWRIYGGHRLWHAPEMRPRTYAPDNDPVKLEWDGDTLHLTAPREEWTAVQKGMEITLSANSNHVRVLHRITNLNLWEVELSAWAITVFREGAKAILPRTPYGKHGENLVAAQTISLWRYTNMADPRLTWGERFIQVRTDTQIEGPQKIGILNTEGWGACILGEEVFLKTIQPPPGVPYPDLNANTQVYTNGDMLELETLSPLTHLERGESVDWVENWMLLSGAVPTGEAELEAFLLPHVESTKGYAP